LPEEAPEPMKDLRSHIRSAKRSAKSRDWYNMLNFYSEAVQCLPDIRAERPQSSELEDQLEDELSHCVGYMAFQVSEFEYITRERKKELRNELRAVIRIKDSPKSSEREKIEAFAVEQTLRWALEPPEMRKAVRYMSPRKFIRIKGGH
jgi:hypothetical protein